MRDEAIPAHTSLVQPPRARELPARVRQPRSGGARHGAAAPRRSHRPLRAEPARWRVRLAVSVVAPAGDCVVAAKSARMNVASGDSHERPGGDIELAVVVPSPTQPQCRDCVRPFRPLRLRARPTPSHQPTRSWGGSSDLRSWGQLAVSELERSHVCSAATNSSAACIASPRLRQACSLLATVSQRWWRCRLTFQHHDPDALVASLTATIIHSLCSRPLLPTVLRSHHPTARVNPVPRS